MSVDYFDQQAALPAFKQCWPEYQDLNAGSLQATVKRADFAFQRFFKLKSGYPRFKAKRNYSGWTYPDSRQGFKVHSDGVNGTLELRDLKLNLQMRGKARDWGRATTCTILYRNDKWYASITVEVVTPKPYPTGNGAIGIDLGVATAVTVAKDDGSYEEIENPQFVKRSAQKHRRTSKRLRRKRSPNFKKRIKASRRWKKQRRHLSRIESKIARQRKDWQHQLTTHIVSGNSLVGAEKLNTRGMTCKGEKRKRQKAGLNRNILNVGFGTISAMLRYKLRSSSGFYVECPTRQIKPTQRCPECWKCTPHELHQRVFHCQYCHHEAPRDQKSALINLMYARGLERSSSVVDESSSTLCGSMKQLAQLKRQKQLAQCSG